MNFAKKVILGLFIVIFLNYGLSLVMKFFAVKTNTYADYVTWLSFLIIMWMFLPKENDFTFNDSSNDAS